MAALRPRRRIREYWIRSARSRARRRRPAARLGRVPTGPLRINLGAGSQHAPGWIGYDRSRIALLTRYRLTRRLFGERYGHWPPTTQIHDLSKGIPHATGSVDVVYSSHTLEHFTEEGADALLAECYRVLKPDGLIRIVVPDFKVIARAYLDGDTGYYGGTGPIADHLARDLYMPRGHESIVRRALKRLLRSDDGGHKWLFDEESLKARLEKAGFRDVHRTAFGESADPSTGALDIRNAENLHMEGFR